MPLDLFLHIPKCGGSSIRTLITQNYAKNRTIGFGGNWDEIIWFRCTPELYKRRYSIVHGHFPWNMHFGLSSNFRYFTFLRDPVTRHFSDYFYQKFWEDAPLHQEITDNAISIEQWATIFSAKPQLSNCLVRYIADDLFSPSLLPGSVDLAFSRLQSEMAAFGIVERFHESVLLIGRALGWRNVLFEVRNVNATSEVVGSALKDKAAGYIEDDIGFYNRSCELFEERVHAGGSLLADATAELRELSREASEQMGQDVHRRFVIGENTLSISKSLYDKASSCTAIQRWLL
ncbi:sulfotransferase family 2 domain-containing protein [Azospirillum melinis]